VKRLPAIVAAAAVASAFGLCGSDAAAQGPLLPGRVEVGIGAVGSAALDLGTADAEQTTPQGGTLTLFETSSRLQPALGIEARIGVGVSRRVQIDAHVSYGRSDLRTRITNDHEDIANGTLAEPVKQIGVGAALTLHFPGWSATSRAIPFVSVGGSYLRELHDGQTLVDEGHAYQFAGGLKYLLGGGTPARPTGVGIRAEVRASVRSRGVAFDDDPILAPAAAAGLFFRF
jgi:hypothetical protein